MSHKILVIDDDLDSLKLIGILLQRQGYQVITAHDGVEGLERAKNEPPDLILLDLMMPGMDGFEVCRHLRDNPHLAPIPIIMFTAKTRVDDKVAGFEAGADDYLTKPTHPAELAARIKALLSRPEPHTDTGKESARGKVIAVMGVKGGSGATTLAVNLSLALADPEKKLILADLQRGMGAIGLHVGRPQGCGLAKLLGVPLNQLGQLEIKDALEDYHPGVELLLTSFEPLDAQANLPTTHARRITELLSQTADLVVLDLGCHRSDTHSQLLKQADLILLCLIPQRTAFIMAQHQLRFLNQIGITSDRLGLVLMPTGPSARSAGAEQIGRRLGVAVLGEIPAAPELALAAIENETPMIFLEPSGPVANQFRQLASRVKEKLTRTS